MTNNGTSIIKDDEIDLIALVKTIWEGKKSIFISLFLFGCIGILVAVFSQKTYTASTTMVPQVSSGGASSSMMSLASMAGFNLDLSSGDEPLAPNVYPEIIQSVPFQIELMNKKFNFEEVNEPISLLEYYKDKTTFIGRVKKHTIGLMFAKNEIVNSDTINNVYSLSKAQTKVGKILSKCLSLEIDKKEGTIVLSSKFEEAKLAAQVAQTAKELLQDYITQFKIRKALAELDFIRDRYSETKTKFENAQRALADFRDGNRNVTSARAKTQEELLSSEYQLAFNVYSELAKQKEQAHIKVKEETPVFATLKPVIVPREKTSPKRLLVVIISLFLGGFVGLGYVFSKIVYQSVKSKWAIL